MTFILDTCTINNLLQVDLISNDEEYALEYDYLSKISQKFEIKLPKKIYDELNNTFEKNLSSGKQIEFIRNYKNRYICSYIDSVIKSDFDSALSFVQTVCLKENDGEIEAVAYALYLNRYKDDLTTFQTYFITDDDRAIHNLKDFFRSNFLGEIFTTIDLLLILSIYEIISHKNVMNFAHNLKKQYIQNYSDLIYEIEALQKMDISAKESSFLTRLYENIEKLDFEKIRRDRENNLYSNIKSKENSIDTLLNKILSEDLNKVKILDEKIEEIKSKYWTMDKI